MRNTKVEPGAVYGLRKGKLPVFLAANGRDSRTIIALAQMERASAVHTGAWLLAHGVTVAAR
jgi:hypothetical protein